MENMINKRFCLVYDTFQDMINDPDIIADMVVMTLGFDSIDDGRGNIYKIILKGTNNSKNLNGESFGPKSSYFAKVITMHDGESLRKELSETKQLLKGMGDAINAAMIPANLDMDDVYNGINKTLNTSNNSFQEYYLDKDLDIKVVQTFDGLRYILHLNKILTKFEKEVEITEETSWLIPTEFVISNYVVNSKAIDCGNINYQDNKVIFKLDFSDPRPLVIPY